MWSFFLLLIFDCAVTERWPSSYCNMDSNNSSQIDAEMNTVAWALEDKDVNGQSNASVQ